jgi:DNA polymerase-1
MEFAPTAATIAKQYDVVGDSDGLSRLVRAAEAGSEIGVHVLTDGEGPTRASIIGFAIATAPRTAWFVPVGRTGGSLLDPVQDGVPLDESLSALRPLFEREAPRKVGHDLKTAAIVLARHRVTLAGLGLDTMIASYLIDPTRSAHTLEDTALEHLGYKALAEARAPKRLRWRRCRPTR